jgi:nucleotide sugar dehydrogenase
MYSKKTTVSVIGLGYVGLPLALLARKRNYRVIGLDNDSKKIKTIQESRSPFFDRKIEGELRYRSFIVTNKYDSISEADIVIVCVPTPVFENHQPNLNPIKHACKNLSPFLKRGSLVVIESTVNPGVCEDVVLPIIEKNSNLKCGKGFYLAHCPERINPGDVKWNLENIPRVIGGYDKISLAKASSFYSSILRGALKRMRSIKEAEACKIVENSFRDINIAFVNELAKSFDKSGIDIMNVIEGASTKPFGFLPYYPGCGVGGHCIPVDPYYLIKQAKNQGFDHKFLRLAREINNSMPTFTVKKVMEGLKENGKILKKSRVTVLGLSYKANISDDRESPSYKIINKLKKSGAVVVCYDPFLPEKSNVDTLDNALKHSDVIIIATAHKLFLDKITPSCLLKKNIDIIIDGRNCLDKRNFVNAGIIYKGVGR